jgi:hypothetical protein
MIYILHAYQAVNSTKVIAISINNDDVWRRREKGEDEVYYVIGKTINEKRR